MSSQAPLRLDARALTKSYGGVTVLDRVDIALAPGEVRALLGENGAGKSTLIKILSGVVRPDRAEIRLDDEPADISGPREAMAAGIATLHQELSIVPGLSVAENVLLGQKTPTRFGKVRWRELARRAEDLFDQLGHPMDVRRDVESLSPVGRTMTALARALSQDSRLLVLDEPTASLTDSETTLLFAAMDRLRARGVSILYVSHRLAEVVEVCDTFTVLRNGQLVAAGDVADVTIDQLITHMAGRPIEAIFPPRISIPGETVLSVEGLRGPTVDGVSFTVAEGEVFGIAGLAGSGRSEILRLLAGAQPRLGGRVVLRGHDLDPSHIRAGHRRGVAMVPQERRTDGLVPASIERNANITTVARHARSGVVMSRRRANDHATGLADDLDLRYRDLGQQILTLSGGNQQKVVLAKFLALDPNLLLLDEPTRGVDVATKSQIYHLIEDRAAAGASVIMVSSELPELIGLAHRIAVMHEGHLTGIFDATTATETALLHACYGRTQ
ncbi:MAG: sugar ABC transporter ATP-binding protein [Acidimicrobiales bacterium]